MVQTVVYSTSFGQSVKTVVFQKTIGGEQKIGDSSCKEGSGLEDKGLEELVVDKLEGIWRPGIAGPTLEAEREDPSVGEGSLNVSLRDF